MAKIDVSAVVTEFGNRYTNEGQTMKDIRTQLFQRSVTENFFKKIPCENDYYRSVYASIDEVLQAWGVDFVKKGTLTFNPWEQKLGEFKIDASIVPDDFRGSWEGFLADIAKPDRSKWPFMIWYIKNELLPSVQKSMEEKVSYWGWQMTGTAATPSTDTTTHTRLLSNESGTLFPANAAMDGIRMQIIKMVAKSRAKVINTGIFSTTYSTFCGQIEAFIADIPRTLRTEIDYLFMSEDNANLYADGRRAKYNTNYLQESDLYSIKNSRVKVQSLPSMDDSDKIWCTPAKNRIQPVKVDNSGVFDVQRDKRTVNLLSDWKKGLAFAVPEFIYTNDLENSITAAEITKMYS